MEKTKLEKIMDEAIFCVDIANFQKTIFNYDPILANQTVLFGSEEYTAEEENEIIEED